MKCGITSPDPPERHSEDQSKNKRRAAVEPAVVAINSHPVSRPFRDSSAGCHFAVK